jgi:hypothetical protein
LPAERQNPHEPISRLPAILALVLLAVQIVIPWTVPHFVTQDGPSHVYSAVTARDLLIHRHSIQRTLYHFRPGVIPNWTSTILLAAIATIAGAGNAERVMVDVIVILGFFSFRYAARALSGSPLGFSPLANFLFNSWFLWLGFFNFALGMALCPALIGYYVHYRRELTLKRAVLLGAGAALLFFTHLIPTVITVLAISMIALWTRKEILRTAAALLPTIALAVIYATGKRAVEWEPGVVSALVNFPLHVFATAAGRVGGQDLLVPGIVLYIAVAILGLRRVEWRSERGGLVLAMLICFALYLVVPDRGLGGQESKIRFAYAVMMLGGLVAASAPPLSLKNPLAIYIAVLMSCNLAVTRHALWTTSHAVEDYISATDRIPKDAVFVRIHYPTPNMSDHYGLADMGRDPFFHLDAYSASRRGSVDLTDYEGLNPIFPLGLRPRVTDSQRFVLWSMEGAGSDVAKSLAWLRESLPVPIDYVVVVSDGGPGTPELGAFTASLESEMGLFAASPGNLVRIYHCPPRIALR